MPILISTKITRPNHVQVGLAISQLDRRDIIRVLSITPARRFYSSRGDYIELSGGPGDYLAVLKPIEFLRGGQAEGIILGLYTGHKQTDSRMALMEVRMCTNQYLAYIARLKMLIADLIMTYQLRLSITQLPTIYLEEPIERGTNSE